MTPQTRAIIAASAYALITGKKVAGLHDHSTTQDLRIAAEAKGQQLQGHDGDRAAKFHGVLPEIYDAGAKAFFSLAIDGETARGYDRASSCHYSLKVTGETVQVYDHSQNEWFAFSVQVA